MCRGGWGGGGHIGTGIKKKTKKNPKKKNNEVGEIKTSGVGKTKPRKSEGDKKKTGRDKGNFHKGGNR